ncbi:secretion system protein [Candidatus Saccharibacteria bacterium]|nr:secretion system protein [Candidatus Saccharibacteria bacterium]MBJ58414.1 secretion system protein [Candidatus Saccharibacteria bacterium]MBQ69270.1 secretion system protein [Candidatus Saccharibacteria bacterium]|tara:strand:+ start:1059 stop:2291 length:1233 start_codon:yes stop_codon:yes gene_type:complete
MAQFSYVAIDAERRTINGKIELADRAAVIAALQKQGLRPITIQEVKSKGVMSGGNITLFQKNKVKSDQLVIFTRQLSAMVSAGVPLLRALTSLESHAENQTLKRILGGIIKDVESGTPLADALEKYPETFNDIYTNMVRAGEAAGILDDILKRLAFQQEKSAAIRKRIKSAMTYPTVLIVITVLAFFGLMIFVIPQIGKILTDLGGPDAELPVITQVMLAISAFIIDYWYILFPALFGIAFGIFRYLKTKRGKRQFDTLVLKIPGINGIIKKIAIARFSRTFSALMGAGVAVLECLNVTSRAVGNTLYAEAIRAAALEVKNGKALSEVIEKNELFPAIVAQMLSVGEETGQTDTVLVKVAEFYEEEVDLAIDGVSSIIEPVMIVVMGGMVGLIAASVMTPIASLSQNIQA